VEYALVEGVMGLFDGIKFESKSQGKEIPDFASTAHIARLLDIPVLLVIDCRSLSGSVAAIAHGYRTLDPRVKIAGVILNKVGSDRHIQLLKDALEPLNLPILGVLRRQDTITIPDRHLGLVPTEEINQLQEVFDKLATLAENCFDWEQILPLLKTNIRIKNTATSLSNRTIPPQYQGTKIAVAKDKAFSFYYQDNLDILQNLGAELVFWSPLKDEKLPPGVQGLYFGGGFPEVFSQELASNELARKAVKKAIEAGIPTYAECGGLMYLCEAIVDFAGKTWEMVGILPSQAVMGKKLSLGYRRGEARQNSMMLKSGEVVWGHEFHRSQLTSQPREPLFTIKSYRVDSPETLEGWQLKQLYASYVHLHFGEYYSMAERFIQLGACMPFQIGS
jgi:cobyrinic acid a,c-diamide synthase